MPLPKVADILAEQVMGMSCDEQFHAAKRIAANIGHKLVPEDSIQAAEDMSDILERLRRLESAVHELNPGWMP